MAIGTICGLYATAISAIGGLGATRMSSDLARSLEEDRDAIASGAVKFQIAATYLGLDQAQDSGPAYFVWGVQIFVHHKLASPANERAWTEGASGMPLFQSSLAAPAFWKVAGVFDVALDSIDFTDAPTREGNVVSFSIEAHIRTTSF